MDVWRKKGGSAFERESRRALNKLKPQSIYREQIR
jgi:hypothetical protein